MLYCDSNAVSLTPEKSSSANFHIVTGRKFIPYPKRRKVQKFIMLLLMVLPGIDPGVAIRIPTKFVVLKKLQVIL